MSPPQDPDSCHLKGAATPVPAAEHQAAPCCQAHATGAHIDRPCKPGRADIAAHQPQAPSVRYVEPDRAAFITLYEAANAFLERAEEQAPQGRLHPMVDAAGGRLRQVLDQAAPAYGRALVARAEKLTAERPGHIGPEHYAAIPHRIVAPWGVTPEQEAEMLARECQRGHHEWVFMSGAGEREVCRRCHQPKETGGQ